MGKEKIVGNYLTQPNSGFPLDCETLDYIQSNTSLLEVLGNMAGDRVILSGCAVRGSTRGEGYVYVRGGDDLRGEVFYFAGGTVNDYLHVATENISLDADNVNYPAAYTRRRLEQGRGTTEYRWDTFSPLTSNKELADLVRGIQAQVAALQGVPVGTILIWPSDNLPDGYHLCDGGSLNRTEYALLYSVIGTTYGGSGTTFNRPNLKGRFVAGKDGGSYYQRLGYEGGANTVTLTAAQSGLRAHNHTAQVTGYRNNSTYGTHTHRFKRGANEDPLTLNVTVNSCADLPASESHENRPPFITMNYIIKVK